MCAHGAGRAQCRPCCRVAGALDHSIWCSVLIVGAGAARHGPWAQCGDMTSDSAAECFANAVICTLGP